MQFYTVLYYLYASRTGTGGVYPEMIMEKINNLPDYQVNAKPQEKKKKLNYFAFSLKKSPVVVRIFQ